MPDRIGLDSFVSLSARYLTSVNLSFLSYKIGKTVTVSQGDCEDGNWEYFSLTVANRSPLPFFLLLEPSSIALCWDLDI